jgi:hypothetical protein
VGGGSYNLLTLVDDSDCREISAAIALEPPKKIFNPSITSLESTLLRLGGSDTTGFTIPWLQLDIEVLDIEVPGQCTSEPATFVAVTG